jgi:hypothetical protein
LTDRSLALCPASAHREAGTGLPRAIRLGRDSVSVFWAPADRAAIDGYTKLGVERVIFALPPESREKVLPILDQYAKFVV